MAINQKVLDVIKQGSGFLLGLISGPKAVAGISGAPPPSIVLSTIACWDNSYCLATLGFFAILLAWTHCLGRLEPYPNGVSS